MSFHRWRQPGTKPSSYEAVVLPARRSVDPAAINEAIDRGWGYETIAYVLNRTVEEIIIAGSKRP